MNDTEGVTGGDLYRLWQVANIDFPTAAKFYVDKTNDVHELDFADTGKLGRCHHWWAHVATIYERVLNTTSENLVKTGEALNNAVDAYKYTDGDNAGKLTEAGSRLEEILGDADLHDPDTELTDGEKPGDLTDPRWAPPDDWFENQNEGKIH